MYSLQAATKWYPKKMAMGDRKTEAIIRGLRGA
jgi:hypothetical protein